MSKSDDEALARWAEDPSAWGDPAEVLTGEAAAAYGRGLLESAGIDVAAVERSVGRPRIGGAHAPKGVRSPRVNVAISDQTDELLDQLGKRRGVSRSVLVREALDTYLRQAV
jgi:hypothetical protein